MFWETNMKSVQFTPYLLFGAYKIAPVKCQKIWLVSKMFTNERGFD